jgi:hypothetical protein
MTIRAERGVEQALDGIRVGIGKRRQRDQQGKLRKERVRPIAQVARKGTRLDASIRAC